MYFHLLFNISQVSFHLFVSVVFVPRSSFESLLLTTQNSMGNGQVVDLCQLLCHFCTFPTRFARLLSWVDLSAADHSGKSVTCKGAPHHKGVLPEDLVFLLIGSTCPTVMFFIFLMILQTLTSYCFK